MTGHTENWDVAFGLVKRQLMNRDVLTPADTFKAIDDSSVSNQTVCSTNVRISRWKGVLHTHIP